MTASNPHRGSVRELMYSIPFSLKMNDYCNGAWRRSTLQILGMQHRWLLFIKQGFVERQARR